MTHFIRRCGACIYRDHISQFIVESGSKLMIDMITYNCNIGRDGSYFDGVFATFEFGLTNPSRHILRERN